MTAPKKDPMPWADRRRLAGLATAAKPGHMAMIGARGAAANLAKNGPDQPLRASLIRRGYDIATIAPSRRKSSTAVSGGGKSQEAG